MNRRHRSAIRTPTKRDEGFNRFLKPGALAQLRNSRISAKSHRFESHSQICLVSSPVRLSTAAEAPAAVLDDPPCFAGRIYGPRFPQRKRLVAAHSGLFLISGTSSPVADAGDPVRDLFGSDAIAAH